MQKQTDKELLQKYLTAFDAGIERNTATVKEYEGKTDAKAQLIYNLARSNLSRYQGLKARAVAIGTRRNLI